MRKPCSASPVCGSSSLDRNRQARGAGKSHKEKQRKERTPSGVRSGFFISEAVLFAAFRLFGGGHDRRQAAFQNVRRTFSILPSRIVAAYPFKTYTFSRCGHTVPAAKGAKGRGTAAEKSPK